MTRRCLLSACLGLLVPAFHVAAAQAPRGATARALVDALLARRATSGLRIRATLTRTTAGGAKSVKQLRFTVRRDKRTAMAIYEVLWPLEEAEALVVEDNGDHRIRGFRYRAGRVTPLSTHPEREPLFGSDLLLADVAESFWYWPSATIVGTEAIGEYDTSIIELRPPVATSAPYSRLRAFVAPAIGAALRIDQFGPGGRLAKRLSAYRVLKVEDRWLPTILTAEPADGKSRTVIEGVSYESKLRLAPSDFTAEAVARLSRPPD